jgi:hypothetical protein
MKISQYPDTTDVLRMSLTMDKSTSSLIWKLIIASFVVGIFLYYFGIYPVDLISNLPNVIGDILDLVLQFIRWAGKYILLGAVVVIPLYILFNLKTIISKIFSKK